MAEEVTVHLPLSVENLIQKICMEQQQNPLDSKVRHDLALIGEQQALQVLTKISKTHIKTTFTKFTQYMINKYYTSSTSENQYQHNSNASPSSPATPHFSFTSPLNQVSFGTTHSPVAEHQRCSLDSSTETGEEKGFSAAMEALGELEFRKAFLLLSYIGGESLENAITAEMIRSLKDLPMVRFEKEIWDAVGKRYMNSDKKERQLYLDWDSGRPHVYHCYVSPNGSLRFKGPILQSTWTHLQKSLGDENVLVVKFAEESNVRDSVTNVQESSALYRKFGKEGIHVGLRLYRFFVFKDGGKEEKKKDPTTSSVKCYFVRMNSSSSSSAVERAPYILSNKTMFEARSLFMHVHMLANLDKYMARFSLILSKTLTLKVDWETVHVEDIDDIICKDENGNPVYDSNGKARIHTDGTGFISADLAVLCPCNVSEGRDPKTKYIGEITNLVDLEDMSKEMGGAECRHQPPLLIQCRLFHMGSAIKGTLLLNRKLPPRTIQVRPSMIKVPRDKSLLNIHSINSMEVVGTSNKPNRSYLSKYLIALLSYGGVPNEFFMDILRSNLEETNHVYSNKRAALKASVNHGEMDDYNSAEMILSGISLNEPFLQYHLSKLAREEKKRLRAGKLYVSDCFYLMGTVDPTGLLQRNEICIIHGNGQITGPVLVYRNPGLHFGDIHIMQATYMEELESYVGSSKFAIFFPCVGPRSVADEIAGGDFDGDMYWVSKNPQLLQYFKSSDPWVERTAPCNAISSDSSVEEPSVISDELEEQLFGLYLRTRFEPSSAVGVAADSWMALMDRLLTLRNGYNKEKQLKYLKESILQLIDIYYEALDAPKKGGRKIHVPKDLAVEMFPHYMEKNKSFTSTSILGSIYDEVDRWQDEDLSRKEITKLPCFDVEIPVSYMEKWKALYEEYRKDMTNALNHNSNTKDEAAQVIQIYQEKLSGAARTEDSLYYEALAVYHVTYDYAILRNDVKKCAFAWKVAGSTLTNIYIVQQNLNARVFNPSVLREIFGS
ncbi:putative RNA-directed RNA polymerase [Lupinus albus]|uniref:RNA-dependent RNA polymerase n=1 Tax=Lupinus albus TaxID=3870 RepID=A0A6A4PFS3_LUPAL|nr:putative RNA-directed RNA polymerase [Lupinus albus]